MSDWNNYWNTVENSKICEFFYNKFHKRPVSKAYNKLFNDVKLKKPHIIEIGCGPATFTMQLLKKFGGTATLVDKSKNVLNLAERRFNENGLKAKYIESDLFDYETKNKADIVHSEGLIEHFIGKQQEKVIDIHKQCMKKNGLLLISVPSPDIHYKFVRKLLEIVHLWPFGYEYPLKKKELKMVLEHNGLNVLRTLKSGRYVFALATKN